MQETRQSLLYRARPPAVRTSVSPVECYVCGKGPQDGHSISARTLRDGTALFCNVHAPP